MAVERRDGMRECFVAELARVWPILVRQSLGDFGYVQWYLSEASQ